MAFAAAGRGMANPYQYMQQGRFMNPQQAAAMYNRAHQLAAAAAATPASLTLPITTHGTGPIMVPNRQLHELLGRINPQIRMDASVEEVLLELTNEFDVADYNTWHRPDHGSQSSVA